MGGVMWESGISLQEEQGAEERNVLANWAVI